MLKKILLHISKIGNLVLAWFNFCMFFAMRPCWSGISKMLKYESSNSWFIYNLPVFVWVLFFLIALTCTILYIVFYKKDKNVWSYVFNGVNIAFFIVVIVVIALGAKDYMDYILPIFGIYVGIAAILLALIFLIFIYPKTKLVDNKIFKYGLISVICLSTALVIVDFSFNTITTGAVVYAVGEDYQIVFSSKTNSRAWVEIGGEKYFDNYNGSNRSYTRIHKITVPQSVLDDAKQYDIHVQKITYEGPFGGWFGRDIKESYNFRPVDSSDGFDFYSLADIHMAGDASYKSASAMKEKELLVLAGDIVSMMDSFEDANMVNEFANQITNGEIPVVYARGNHELKGRYSEQFHNFVGADGEKFYYNFKLDNVYGVVLDMGEDHEDEYWEYYDTAYYDQYRNEQVKFLEKEYEKGEYLNYDYRLAVCHIPVALINTRGDHIEPKQNLTKALNDLDVNLMISGHQHDLFILEPGTIEYNKDGKLPYNPEYSSSKPSKYKVTDHNFVNILVSKRGYTQTDDVPLTNMSSQIGLGTKVDFKNNKQTCFYLNSRGEKINTVNPFAPINYGTEMVFDLSTNKHI